MRRRGEGNVFVWRWSRCEWWTTQRKERVRATKARGLAWLATTPSRGAGAADNAGGQAGRQAGQAQDCLCPRHSAARPLLPHSASTYASTSSAGTVVKDSVQHCS